MNSYITFSFIITLVDKIIEKVGEVAICTGGTADIPVAEEAAAEEAEAVAEKAETVAEEASKAAEEAEKVAEEVAEETAE